MHIQKPALRSISIILCIFVLIMSVWNYPITAHASTTSAVSVNKVFDMALSKAGVVASPSTINSIKDYLYTLMLDYGDSYLQYLMDNNLDNTPENCQAYFDTLDYSSYSAGVEDICRSYTMAKFMSDFYSFFDEQIDENTVNDTNLLSFLGLKDAVKGATYSIGSDFVNLLKLIFEKKTVNDLGYFYIPTLTADDLDPTFFSTNAKYTTAVNSIKYAGDYVVFLQRAWNGAYCTEFINYDGNYIVVKSSTDTTIQFSIYSASTWKVPYCSSKVIELGTVIDEEYINNLSFNTAIENTNYKPWSTNYPNIFAICTPDGRPLLAFNSLDALKLYSVEKAPYYVTRGYGDYSTTNDNSVTYTGDYMIEYGDTTTYGDITTNNDYSQDTIDNSVTNITNNYYYTTPEGDGGGSGDSGDGGGNLWDGLTSLVDGITSFLNFILTACGDIINLLSTFLTTAFDMVVGFAETFAGFADFIGDIFEFIPDDLIELFKAGITISILLGVIKTFLK